jgi:hypothetical protein
MPHRYLTESLQAVFAVATLACGADVMQPSVLQRKDWPNEPPGLRVVADWGFDHALPDAANDIPIPGSSGWNVVSRFLDVSRGTARGFAQQAEDRDAPMSPGAVYDFVYPEGMVEGVAPATVYFNLSAREVYVGFWWKPSSPFDRGPNGNKIAFLFNGGGDTGGQQFMTLLPDGRLHVLPEYPGDFQWRRPNVNATVVRLGVWHLVEWHADRTTGMLEWWLDGTLQGRHTDVRNSRDFDMFQFSPTWGGNSGARKSSTDHYWFDHVRLSAR